MDVKKVVRTTTFGTCTTLTTGETNLTRRTERRFKTRYKDVGRDSKGDTSEKTGEELMSEGREAMWT